MKRLFVFLSCFIVLPVLAQNAIPFCTSMSTRITVRTKPGNPQYITQYSREDFLRKADAQYSPYTLGLTVVKPEVTVSVKPDLKELLGQICVALSDVEIEMSYPSMTVYIDKKYMPSSCEYRTIKEHEDYHVNVAQQALSFFRPDVERVVSQTVETFSPKIVFSRSEISPEVNKFASKINEALKPVVKHIKSKLDEKNAAIDTQEMYHKTTAVCQNW